MIVRLAEKGLLFRLEHFPSVCILGARQVGKTTLVKSMLQRLHKEAVYLDLENPDDLARLQSPMLFLQAQADKTVVIDEVQRMPELFPILRSLIDQQRDPGRFVLLGSASPDIIRDTAESLAGRISWLRLYPFCLAETGGDWKALWVRGGFPNAFLQENDDLRKTWFADFITSYVQKDLPQLGFPADALLANRLLTMLAGSQGGILNASALGKGLQLTHTTVTRYLDFLENAFLIRRVQPYFVNMAKRLVKSPKCYLIDTGFVHSLLRLWTFDDLMGHMTAGYSWEAFVLQQLLAYLKPEAGIFFYRTHDGAELDFVLENAGKIVLAIESKLTNAPSLSKGTTIALQDLGNPPLLVVTPEAKDFPMREGVQVCSVATLLHKLKEAGLA